MEKPQISKEQLLINRIRMLEDEREVLRATLLTVMECNQLLRQQLMAEGSDDPYNEDQYNIDLSQWTTH